MIQQGTDVLVKKSDGVYRCGYVLSLTPDQVQVEVESQREWYQRRDVYVLGRGGIPVSLETIHKEKPTASPYQVL